MKTATLVLRTLLGTAMLAAPLTANAATLTTLYTFNGQDGAYPMGGLLNIGGGRMIGTTYEGDAGNNGTAFQFNRFSGAKHNYSFVGISGPIGPLINVGGTLYGTSYGGGAFGGGSVFSLPIDPTPGSETVLHSFGAKYGGPDGYLPYPGGLLNVEGTLYGTTSQGGGPQEYGTVFSLNLNTGGYHVVHSFEAPDTVGGVNPGGPLINVGGTLYGTTQYGGTFGGGTIFSYDLATKITTVIYSFTNGADGGVPTGPLTNVGSLLYGTTSVVFAFDLSTGLLNVVYSFTGPHDAVDPNNGVTYVNGKLYGTAGYHSGDGTVYEIDLTTGVEQVLYSFSGGSDGWRPLGPLIEVGGALWGVTEYGGNVTGSKLCRSLDILGTQFGCGTIFRLTP